MKKTKGFWVQAKGKKAEIYIYETIGDGWLGGMSAKSFSEELKGLGEVEQIDVFISSDGGSVFDGISIYNQLKRSKAKVIINIDGIAASIASVIAMAGDEVYMASNAQMMIHKAWTVVSGNADELRKQADIMDKIDEETIVAAYVEKSGESVEKMNELLAAETWLSSSDALDLGLIDGVTEEIKMAAHYDLSRFSNVPDKLKAAMKDMLDPEKPRLDQRRDNIARVEVAIQKLKNKK